MSPKLLGRKAFDQLYPFLASSWLTGDQGWRGEWGIREKLVLSQETETQESDGSWFKSLSVIP